VEFARHVVGLDRANSSEFDEETAHPVIHLMAEQRGITKYGATMRLGAYDCLIQPGTLAARIYGAERISERHRHRYEFNNDYRAPLEQGGMTLSGLSPDGRLVEMIELKDHPFFIACQFHPEFKSRPAEVHPLFEHFVGAALARRQQAR
jgi:CTP synthase